MLELKWWQEQFDWAMEMMGAAQTEEEAVAQWKRSHEAEKNFHATYDWLTAHGYTVVWNEVEQCYQVKR